MNNRVLSLCCHPDDTEFFCAGTLALLSENGWEIHSGTMTAGDGGTAEYTREEISKIRTREAEESVNILGGEYHCLWCEDVFVTYDKPTLLKAIELIPGESIILEHIGDTYIKLHKKQKALNYYRQSLEHRQDDMDALQQKIDALAAPD